MDQQSSVQVISNARELCHSDEAILQVGNNPQLELYLSKRHLFD